MKKPFSYEKQGREYRFFFNGTFFNLMTDTTEQYVRHIINIMNNAYEHGYEDGVAGKYE